jgi:hypothetical protein
VFLNDRISDDRPEFNQSRLHRNRLTAHQGIVFISVIWGFTGGVKAYCI